MAIPTWISEARDIATILGGVAAACITGIGAYIAFRQANTSRQKLRLDLFPMRFGVFKSTTDMVNIVQRGRKMDDEVDKVYQDYQIKMSEARFVFDREIVEQLNHVYGHIVAIIEAPNFNLSEEVITDVRGSLVLDYGQLIQMLEKPMKIDDGDQMSLKILPFSEDGRVLTIKPLTNPLISIQPDLATIRGHPVDPANHRGAGLGPWLKRSV